MVMKCYQVSVALNHFKTCLQKNLELRKIWTDAWHLVTAACHARRLHHAMVLKTQVLKMKIGLCELCLFQFQNMSSMPW